MEKYDSTLLGILQNEGKLAPFLDVVLGFLYRRTDFFRIMKTDNDKLGFPPGFAKKLLVNMFSKYEMQALKETEKKEEMKRTNEAKKDSEKGSNAPTLDCTSYSAETDGISASPAAQDSSSCRKAVCHQQYLQEKTWFEDPYLKPQGVPVPCDQSDLEAYQHLIWENPPNMFINKYDSQTKPDDERGAEAKDPVTSSCKENEAGSESTTNESGNDDGDTPAKGSGNEEEKEDPELALQRRLLQANPLTYNGAERENYFWSQTITETDLRVKIPAHIKKGKQVRVNIAKKHIKVSHQTDDGSWSTVMDDAMAWEVDTEESMWTLTPGEFVHINLEKKEERWWECVFVDEPKINTRKIDCSRPMTDLDDEAQAKIEEMMYNQRQKQLGLPQSHEQKTHDMLRKAWDAEGSPFKGQPFDPSKLNIDPNGVINVNQE